MLTAPSDAARAQRGAANAMAWRRYSRTIEAYRASLDIAAAFAEQGLLGMVRDESWQCLTLEQIEKCCAITKDPRYEDAIGFELTVNRIPFPSGEVHH